MIFFCGRLFSVSVKIVEIYISDIFGPVVNCFVFFISFFLSQDDGELVRARRVQTVPVNSHADRSVVLRGDVDTVQAARGRVQTIFAEIVGRVKCILGYV